MAVLFFFRIFFSEIVGFGRPVDLSECVNPGFYCMVSAFSFFWGGAWREYICCQ